MKIEKSANSTPKLKTRLIGLDLLRLLAIVLVLGRHMWPPPSDWSGPWNSFILTWERGGWVGVDLFFVLSGFLVSGLLFDEYKSRNTLSFRRFYTRRGWKIYPPFFVLVLVTVMIDLLFNLPIAWRWVLAELLFVQNYFHGIWDYTWSLGVEEHFYLLLPVVLILMLKFNKNSQLPLKPILVLAASFAVIALLLRLLNAYYRPIYSHMTHLYASHLRIDSLFFGVAISYLYHFHTDRFVTILSPWRRWLIVGGITLLMPAFIFQLETTPFIFTIGFTVFYIGSGMLLIGVLLCKFPESRPLAWMAALGAYSYSIYLWHMPVILWGVPLVNAVFGNSLGYETRALIYLTGALAMGVAMALLVEIPALRLRDYWFPPRSKVSIDARSGSSVNVKMDGTLE